MPRRRASTSSGLVFGIAAWVVTTAVGPPGSRSSDDASWPMRICAPRARSATTPRDSLASEPDTSPPRSSRMRAMPDMPAPPMPTMCTRCSSAGSCGAAHRRRFRLIATSALRATSSATSATRCAASRWPASAAAAVIAASRGASPSSPATVSATNSRRQLGVGDHQAAARVDHRQRVESLFAVADRQRHVHRGQADRRHLGDRHRAGPADRQVGGGVGQIHPVQVRHRDVRRIAGCGLGQLEGVLRAVRVQHRNTCCGKVFGGGGDRPVDRLRALRAAEHQQHLGVVGEAEVRARLARSAARSSDGDRRAHRHADHLGAAQPGIRHRGQHPPRRAGADPVGQPALALASWITTGTRRRRSAPPRAAR